MSVKTPPRVQLMPPAPTPWTAITAPVNEASSPAMDKPTLRAQEWSVKVSFCRVTFWGRINPMYGSGHRPEKRSPHLAQAAQLFIAHIIMRRAL